jgi:hypothetical protein
MLRQTIACAFLHRICIRPNNVSTAANPKSRGIASNVIRWSVLIIALACFTRHASAADCSPLQQPTNATEAITCSTPKPGIEVWRIDRPNVKQALTNYPQITFTKGDLVSVFSGGCVQSGGSGLTWKRYVIPVARDKSNDNHYFGQISIPGFGNLRPIRDAVLSGGIAITQDPGGNASLSLGYVDDNHSDNGYWGRDDGLWEQCRDLTDAFVVVTIQHNCATSSSASCIHGRAMDKVVTQRDPNGFPVNPQWVWTALVGTDPSLGDVCSWSIKTLGFPRDNTELCVTAPTQKDITALCDFKGATEGRNSGHVNMLDTLVTYDTSIWLDSVNFPIFEDDDYTFDTLAQDIVNEPTPHNEMSHSLWVTDQNQDPQVEFSDGETVANFSGIQWWSDFQHAAYHGFDSSDTASARRFFGNHEAVVIGMVGFDCAHSCNTELHPAFAFFVHNVENSTPGDDVWDFFVRNRGNEGFCGGDSYILNVAQLSVLLPKPGAIGVSTLPATVVKGALKSPPNPSFSVVESPDRTGAIATFSLPSPESYGVVFGELHLQWNFPVIRPRPLSVQAIATLRAQGLSEYEIQAAAQANSARAMTDLQEKARSRVISAIIEKQKPRNDDIEDEIAERVNQQSSAYQAAMRRDAAALNLEGRRLDDQSFTDKIKAALAGVPGGSLKVLPIQIPADPKVEDFRKRLIQLLPDEAPANPHPELSGSINNP